MTFNEAFEKVISNSHPVESREGAKSVFLANLRELILSEYGENFCVGTSYSNGADGKANVSLNYYAKVGIVIKFKRVDQVFYNYETAYTYIPIKAYCEKEEYGNKDIKEVLESILNENEAWKIQLLARKEFERITSEEGCAYKALEAAWSAMDESVNPYLKKMADIRREKPLNFWSDPDYMVAESVVAKLQSACNQLAHRFKPFV